MLDLEAGDVPLVLLNIGILVAVWWRGFTGGSARIICFCAVFSILMRIYGWLSRRDHRKRLDRLLGPVRAKQRPIVSETTDNQP